jgi:pyruvate/2-oxoacid:ferredoxin oxidoreductase alpha subunit
VEAFIVAEMNLGQMAREIERCVGRTVDGVYHAGGAIIPPRSIFEAVEKAAHRLGARG